MGHFIIHLENGQRADVRWGTIRKKTFPLFPFRKSIGQERRLGYIVQLGTPGRREYRFLRTTDGQWLSQGAPGFTPTGEDALGTELKAAILQHENHQ